MNIVVYDPYEEGRSKESDNIVFMGLDELLECSDFVSIHCVLTPETNGLIGEKEFARMKSSAFLINVSRDAIVDEASLIKALKTRRIAGAGLDVFANEPMYPDHPLLQMDNTILSLHFAYFTSEANERLDREALQAAINILQDRALENIKNPEIL